MTTIKNVAKLAGVSTGTVSNVLSGNRPVSDDVRQRVLAAIEELKYQPNLIASSLVTGKSNTIAAVLSDFQLGLGNLLAGMDAGAREAGFSLLTSRLGYDENPVDQLQLLSNRRVDGIIWVVPETIESRLWWKTAKIKLEIPFVFAFSEPHLNQSSICMDNVSGGYMATRHLIEHGCRKIAHIAGPHNSFEAQERKAGWEKALKEEGFETHMVYECDWHEDGVKDVCEQMSRQWPDMDGLFAVSDDHALVAMNAFQKKNIRIPEDIKVIGFDDIKFLDFANPPLTSVRQDYYTMGLLAAKEMKRRISNPEGEAKAEVIPTALSVRHSCGCAFAS